MLRFLLAHGLIVPGLPVIGIGRDIGDVESDGEGMDRAKHLGQTMARLLNHFSRDLLHGEKSAKPMTG